MKFYEVFLCGIFLLCSTAAYAQTGQCYDEFLVNENAFCNYEFEPVCGCDGITYKNDCYAQNYFGISYSTYGPCGNIAFTLKQNPVRDFFEIEIVLKYKANAQILIYNMQGHLRYRRNLGIIERFDQTFPITHFENGIYLILVESEGAYEYQRFLKL